MFELYVDAELTLVLAQNRHARMTTELIDRNQTRPPDRVGQPDSLAGDTARVIAIGSSTHRFVKKVDDIEASMRPTSSCQKRNYQMRSYQVRQAR